MDENDFLFWIKKVQELRPDEKQDDESKDLLAAFKVFDRDGKGFITKDDLMKAFEMIGEPISDEELKYVLSTAKTDQSGNIRYEGGK